MFWNKKSEKEEGKLAGPKEIPGPLQNYLVGEKILPPGRPGRWFKDNFLRLM